MTVKFLYCCFTRSTYHKSILLCWKGSSSYDSFLLRTWVLHLHLQNVERSFIKNVIESREPRNFVNLVRHLNSVLATSVMLEKYLYYCLRYNSEHSSVLILCWKNLSSYDSIFYSRNQRSIFLKKMESCELANFSSSYCIELVHVKRQLWKVMPLVLFDI